MMSSQFDALAQLYEDFSALPFRQHLEFPTVLGAVGTVNAERKVLDLGCGSGVYSRMLAGRGAFAVTGLDESAGMIGYARRREEAERLGIRYVAGPLPAELHGKFDLVLAVYVLPYASSYPELVDLFRTAAGALRTGGELVTLPIHPDVPADPDYYSRYGFRLNPLHGREDGGEVDLHILFGSYDTHVTAHYWSAPTLEKALAETGFGPSQWHRHRLSDAAAAGPDTFWRPYLDAPHAGLLTAKQLTRRS
ncbi:class I SAM-dependent methyltransferase [Streptomyces sp. NPDC093221]|uniref:class I SAM-dependent methyltransferase n=1 Tax=Streptomyces sp. NPDC093221 TaxID=3366032 RepID=UPI00381C2B29